MNDGSAAAGPRIERVNAKIGTLERRIEWLRSRLSGGGDGRTNQQKNQQTFDRAEVEALEAACAALRYHRTALDAETDPVLALAEMVDAVDAEVVLDDRQRTQEAVARARRVLRELSPD